MEGKWSELQSDKKATYVIVIILVIFITCSIYVGNNRSTSEANLENTQHTEFLKELNYLKYNNVTKDQTNFDSSKVIYLGRGGLTLYKDKPRPIENKSKLHDKDLVVEESSNVKPSALDHILKLGQTGIIIMLFYTLLIKKIAPKSKVETETQTQEETTIPSITFKDIAGNRESKEDVEFMVKFLKSPEKYNEMGARITKGILFYGPPGTGKTLTAKAIAGEAGVPFYSASGSDFVEMYVGVGAKRVRELFNKAKESAPCIVFIDEIDAIGGKRGMDNNSEKDQTINALLDAMDGFKGNNGVIVIAATNRLDYLDPALTRSGRFDRKIAIGLPDLEDRKELINIHARNKKLSGEISIEELSKVTIGFSGADIETLLNEATILAVNREKDIVGNEELEDAYFRLVMQGDKKKNKNDINMDDLELVAYHEAAHALVTKLLTDNDIPKVTIIPSTSGAGGVTFSIPKKMGLFTKKDILNSIKVSYAGRVGELILRKDEDLITTGASQDIRKATQEIMNLFTNYGMSKKYGMLKIDEIQKECYIEEAIELSKELYEETLELVKNNKDKLKKIAEELLDKETLNGEDLDRIIYG